MHAAQSRPPSPSLNGQQGGLCMFPSMCMYLCVHPRPAGTCGFLQALSCFFLQKEVVGIFRMKPWTQVCNLVAPRNLKYTCTKTFSSNFFGAERADRSSSSPGLGPAQLLGPSASSQLLSLSSASPAVLVLGPDGPHPGLPPHRWTQPCLQSSRPGGHHPLWTRPAPFWKGCTVRMWAPAWTSPCRR